LRGRELRAMHALPQRHGEGRATDVLGHMGQGTARRSRAGHGGRLHLRSGTGGAEPASLRDQVFPGGPGMRVLRLGMAAGAIVLAMGTAWAQHKGSGSGSGSGPGGSTNPYAEFAKRRIASFSEEEAAGIVAGRGMGYALPAELNGYPGPMHILE